MTGNMDAALALLGVLGGDENLTYAEGLRDGLFLASGGGAVDVTVTLEPVAEPVAEPAG